MLAIPLKGEFMNRSNGLKIAGFIIVVFGIISPSIGISAPGYTITSIIDNVTVKLPFFMYFVIFGFVLIAFGEVLEWYNRF
jgi:hypothetical protein